MSIQCQEILIRGTPICRGIAIGKAYFYGDSEEVAVPEICIDIDCVEAEIERYRKAVLGAIQEVRQLQARMQREEILDGAAILDGHLQMMQDALLTTHVEQTIRHQCKNAEFVFQRVISECEERFNSIEDPFFKERFRDIQEISKRVMSYLRESDRACLKDIPEDSIIIASELTAFDTAEASGSCVKAFITRDGGVTSHAAIVAKAKGIPLVSNIDIDQDLFSDDVLVIVDGRTGDIIINPNAESLKKYEGLRDQLQHHMLKLERTGKLAAETYDGYTINLSANVEGVGEIEAIHQTGGNGVGLLRTESAFLSREEFPSESEQYESYRKFVEAMQGLPIVIRTFDIGGDKFLRKAPTMYFQQPESNPFLGCRAIRFSLREVDIFKTQLRAILRASAHGNIKIMFPMISSLSELQEAKGILAATKQELIDEGHQVAESIPVGCMIEVPSSAIIADLLAKECDFLSIGTNDLVQYTIAVDRTNCALSDLYAPTHPSVIRLIRLVVNEANHHGIPVSICGEVAADPRFTPLLLGLGVHELSVASRYIPVIKNAIRSTSIIASSKLAEQVLGLSSAAEIEDLLTREYRRNVPEDCFYNC